jgi:GH24 family phage-related lysozyme (muramidase)
VRSSSARRCPRYARDTRRVYPGVEALPADAQGMLLSLVFNRGASMADTDRRREMRQIRPLVAAADLAGIAARVRAMKRLWDIAELPGLHRRRDREAELIAAADRLYEPEELVAV